MRSRIRLLIVFTAVIALLFASCGDSVIDYEPQTLDQFMGWDVFDQQAATEAWKATVRQTEEKIGECMAERGLGYSAPPEGQEKPDPFYGLTDDEVKLQYGYVYGLMLFDHQWEVEYGVDLCTDPDCMWSEHTNGIDMDTYMIAVDECSQRAESAELEDADYEAVYRSLDEAWAPLDADRTSMEEDLQSALTDDSRVVEAEAAWSACMADEGYDFETEDDIMAYLEPMMDETAITIPLNEEVFSLEELQALVDIELAIAAADVACSMDLSRVREELQADYEGEFIAEHRDELEEIRPLEQQLMQMMLEGKVPV